MTQESFIRFTRFLLAAGCFIGLYVKLGFLSGHFLPYTLIYYTNLSNICVLLVYGLSVFHCELIKKPQFLRFKGALVLIILITGLIYHFMLRPSGFSMAGSSASDKLGNFLLHYYTPVFVVLDWLLWDKKGLIKRMDPFLWISVPFLYFLFTIVQAKLGGFLPNQNTKYPYHFIAVDILGWRAVLINVFIFAVVFLILGYGIYLIDQRLK